MIDTHQLSHIVNTILLPALQEDLGSSGDITTNSIFSPDTCASALIKAKEPGVLSGAYLVQPIFAQCAASCVVTMLASDGDALAIGTPIARIEGPIHAILAGERLTLNLLQRLSGIASQTASLVALIEGTGARLLDTRKTTPNLRILEREAVAAGGGTNHRFGLFDMILIKDTHVKAAGGPGEAVRRAQQWRSMHNASVAIEVEVQSVSECTDAARENPERIMLDNMSCHDMSFCVSWLKKKGLAIETEASGNVSAKTIRKIAETGVDFISVGSLTHSVKALDIHLVIE